MAASFCDNHLVSMGDRDSNLANRLSSVGKRGYTPGKPLDLRTGRFVGLSLTVTAGPANSYRSIFPGGRHSDLES